jgi:hypothetical protein
MKTYSWEFDREMRHQHLLCALPLLLRRRDLVGLKLPLPKVGNGVYNNPRDATTKVDNLSRFVISTHGNMRKKGVWSNIPHEAKSSRDQ